MTGNRFSIFGSVGSALLMSMCCVGPVVLSALGVGAGVGLLSQLNAYKPYFLGFMVAMLGLGFYLTYRPRKVVCADGSCRFERAGRWNKLAIWSAAGLSVVFVVLPYVIAAIAQNQPPLEAAIPATAPAETQTSALRKLTLQIADMTCAACPIVVQNYLKHAPGVLDARATLEPPEAVVIDDPAKTRPEQIISALVEPFEAQVLSDEAFHHQ